MDALSAMIFVLNFHVTVFAVAMALYVAAAGYQADDTFCEGVMRGLGVSFALFFMAIFFPLIVLCFWQFFTVATSPYPMLVNVFVVVLFHHSVGSRVQRFLAEALALELYHAPAWFLKLLRSASRGMGTTHLLEEKSLKAAALDRAERLRAQVMGQGGDGNVGASSPSAGAAAVAAHTRKCFRVIAMDS